jgi:glutamyl-tRNA reductase
MHILVVGLNYKTAPVEIRERFTFSEQELAKALRQYQGMKGILECVILSTCNRTELYAVVDQMHSGEDFTKIFISDWFQMKQDEFKDYLYIKREEEAIHHLFEVTCGLDSMILGETQILGQMRDAWQKAGEIGTSGKIFNTLFRQAVTFAKRVHTQTSIGQNAVSVSYAAVQLAKKEIERFASKRVLIVGAGKMSRLTAKHLEELGVDELMVASRTLERAEQLAMEFNGSAYTMEQLADCLKRADIVISSTGAAELVISKAMVEQAMKDRPGSVMLMIDIAVPRDLDPELAQLDSVLLYDIDDLEGIIQSNLEQRRKEAIKIRTLLIQEVNQFKEWFATLEMIPVVSALRKKALLIQEETMRSIERKIPDLDEREKKVLRKHTKSIVNQLLKEPILQLKEMSGTEESAKALELISKIFGLQEFLMEEQAEKEGSFADMSYLEVGS